MTGVLSVLTVLALVAAGVTIAYFAGRNRQKSRRGACAFCAWTCDSRWDRYGTARAWTHAFWRHFGAARVYLRERRAGATHEEAAFRAAIAHPEDVARTHRGRFGL